VVGLRIAAKPSVKGTSMNQSQSNTSDISPAIALCLAAITMAGADGQFKEEELEDLRKLIHFDEFAFVKAFNFYNEYPLDICIKTVSARLNDAQKQVAYRVLYDLAQVDRDFAVSEQDLLEQYAAMFGLRRDFITSVSGPAVHQYDLSVFE
jgi:tellurite resistance protein